MKRSEVISLFLKEKTHADLAELYNNSMEVQVNVGQDNGRCVDKVYKGHTYQEWTDGVQSWKTFRMPLHPNTEPIENDIEQRFDLALHVEAIGMTGWNWREKKSIWVAFDFDAIADHKHEKKLTPQELDEIKEKVSSIDWVTTRRSTSGKGLHLYVFIDPLVDLQINNHNEHAALARAILNQLSSITNFDFEGKVDVAGGNMWVWHRKMVGTNGLEILKQGIPLSNLPAHWKDYIDVVKNKKKRPVPWYLKESEDDFEQISNQRTRVELDAGHKKLLEWIEQHTPGGSYWDVPNNMLVTHTYTLKLAHQALGFKGVFDTISQGTEHGTDRNCYAFPQPEGAWTVRRFSKGTPEHAYWFQDGLAWTTIHYNCFPDFNKLCEAKGGAELENGSFAFQTVADAIPLIKMLGITIDIPDMMIRRTAILTLHKDRRLIIRITKERDDRPTDIPGFECTSKPKYWSKILSKTIDAPPQDTIRMDRVIRHIISEAGSDMGWVVCSDRENWRDERIEHIKLLLDGEFGFKPGERTEVMGNAIFTPYTIINQPFEPEYQQGRLWNRDAARLRFSPNEDTDDLKFPTWLKIYEHLGRSLTPYVKSNIWCKGNNIQTGADYLLLWVAAMFQKPLERLPYLFFYSEEQDSGKSTFHESIALLMGSKNKGQPPLGYMKISEALKGATKFNDELRAAVLCVIEELDLNPKYNEGKTSYNKIKDLVTSQWIEIGEKFVSRCMGRNTTHWVQASNTRSACPVFKNDTRIVVIRVNPIDDIDKIPRIRLHQMLEEEAPDFLAHILKLEIPPSNDRLTIPVIETEEKHQVQEGNMNLLEQFLKEQCHYWPGQYIYWGELFQKFRDWIDDPSEQEKWPQRYTGKFLPEIFPKGRNTIGDTGFIVGNISFKKPSLLDLESPRYVLKGNYLKIEGL